MTRFRSETHVGRMIHDAWARHPDLSFVAIAAELGVHRNTVYNWRTNGTVPSDANLYALADLFGVSRKKVDQAARKDAAERRRRRIAGGGAAIVLAACVLGGHAFAEAIGHDTGLDLSGDVKRPPRSDCFATWGVCIDR